MKTRRTLNNKSRYNFKYGKPYLKTKKPSLNKFDLFSFVKSNKSQVLLTSITAVLMIAILVTGIYYCNNRFLVVYADEQPVGYVTEVDRYEKIVKILETSGPASCDAMLAPEAALPKVMGVADTSSMSMLTAIPSKSVSVEQTGEIAEATTNQKKSQYEITTALNLKSVWKRPAELPELTIGSLLQSVNIQVNAAVILIEGQEVAALQTEEEANDIIDIIVKGYTTPRGGRQVVDYSIKEDVKIEFRPVIANTVITRNEALNLLSTGYTQRKVHIVKRGDSLWSIGNDNGMTVKEVRACNPDLKSSVLMLGQKIAVEPIVPYINIETKEQLTTFEYVSYKTVYKQDNSLYTWQTKTLEEGVKGKNEVVYDIVRENGVEKAREKVSTTVISDPVTKVVAKGTKIPEAQGTGSFIWPVDGGGTITCKFGWTGRRYHYGLDIGTPKGTNIFAADDGVVTTSTYHYLYGYYIIIDHGNGYSTLYAHNSKLIAKVGRKVKKGTLIAKSGSTGNSTGPHLHFEIRKNGTRYNPLNYYK